VVTLHTWRKTEERGIGGIERERERELERCKKDETLSIEHTSLLSKAGNPNPNPWELANLGPAVSWRSC